MYRRIVAQMATGNRGQRQVDLAWALLCQRETPTGPHFPILKQYVATASRPGTEAASSGFGGGGSSNASNSAHTLDMRIL